MGIDSSKAKRTDPRPSWQDVAHPIQLCFPIPCLLHDVERAAIQLDVRIDLLTMQTLHELFVLHLQQDFDYPGHSRCPLQVSNITFQRTNPAPSRWPRSVSHRPYQFAECCLESIDFNRVPKSCPCAMRFDIAHCARIYPGLAVSSH